MGLNETPSAERVHIGIFGRRNAGKSSIINAVTGQNLAIVSEVMGTTTDPVSKAMELLPLGPVVLIDTPGLDDEGELGKKRVEKSYQVLNKTDIAVLVIDNGQLQNKFSTEIFETEQHLIELLKEKNIPYILAVNKAEGISQMEQERVKKNFPNEKNIVFLSAKMGENVHELKERIAALSPKKEDNKMIGDLLEPLDTVVLVVPIDSAAPKGRLILPQQQIIRDCLDTGAIPVVTRDTELPQALGALSKEPKMIITDSQVFEKVEKIAPKDVYLTSFSIIMSRYKGDLSQQIQGARVINELKENDVVLISEGCTHHRQCNDIGTVKMPAWIEQYTKRKLQFAFTSGTEFPQGITSYALIVHCGGCTLNEREMKHRLLHAKDVGVPMTNYGIAIAYMHGILDRSVEMFGL